MVSCNVICLFCCYVLLYFYYLFFLFVFFFVFFFFFQAEDGIRDADVTGVQTCALPICWLAVLEPASPALQSRHRLHDEAWINWAFNEFGWMSDQRTLWFVSEEDRKSVV